MARVRRTTLHDLSKWLSANEADVNWIAPVYVPDPKGDYEVTTLTSDTPTTPPADPDHWQYVT